MKKQSGSAHVVIIIVLVLALLTSLGWIFWQNFIYKEPVVTKTDTSKTQSDNDKMPASMKHINVKEWNISIMSEESISYTSKDADTILIKGDALNKAEADNNCKERDSGIRVLRVKTTSVNNSVPYVQSNDVDGYTYLLVHSNQALCVDENGKASQPVNDAYESLFSALKKHWQMLESSNA
ncbi:MAG TPA: hypothetical protein VGE34_03330 [Candidatus Saccharimonadales bacterium]